MSREPTTVRLASVVYADRPDLDDPAEIYHEASKVVAATAAHELAGAARLWETPELQASAARAVRRNLQLPSFQLPPARRLCTSLSEALEGRRSARSFGTVPMDESELATMLAAGYGVTAELPVGGDWTQLLRSAPSAGALYPLELFAIVRRVDDLPPGLYRYDALGAAIEQLRPGDVDPEPLTPYADVVGSAAVVFAIAACFWRSRFKYGLRAYRFTLLEAGHVAQNLLLAAAALGLAATPLGGFYDLRLDELLGLDGVDESALYLVCAGRPGDDG